MSPTNARVRDHRRQQELGLPEPDMTVHRVGRNESRLPGLMQLDLLTYCGLQPDSRLMEIGCGVGRLTYELAAYLTDGAYAGFDISPDAIDWLNTHYAPRLPGFRFDLIDVHNARYRPESGDAPTEVRFPYEDDSFDFSCAFSIYTHMRMPEIEVYLRELRRVLEPGGKGVMTFFAITPRDENPTLDQGRAFVPIGDGAWTFDPELPEKGIAFDEELIEAAAARAGLDIANRYDGRWHGWQVPADQPKFHKDVFVLSPST